jgi:hypothetical protein
VFNLFPKTGHFNLKKVRQKKRQHVTERSRHPGSDSGEAVASLSLLSASPLSLALSAATPRRINFFGFPPFSFSLYLSIHCCSRHPLAGHEHHPNH